MLHPMKRPNNDAPTTRGRRRFEIVAALATLIAAIGLAGSATTSGAVSGSVTIGSSAAWTVPSGVNSITVTLVGGGGGSGGTNCSVHAFGEGGPGGAAKFTMAVTSGDVLFFGIGSPGGNGTGKSNYGGGGGGGYGIGGSGSTGSGCGASGAGGGSGSFMKIGNYGDPGPTVVVVGGGGGGGGAGLSGDGGFGGVGGSSGANGSGGNGGSGNTASQNGGNGDNSDTNKNGGSGGGGGGGWRGGGGGWASGSGGGGGGAGGANFLDTNYVTQIGAFGSGSNPREQGWATIEYSGTYATITNVTPTPSAPVAGQPVSFAIAVTAPDAPILPAGTVQLKANGVNIGGAAPIAADGTVAVPIDGLPAGTTAITATFTPADPSNYDVSTGTANLVVAKGSTGLALSGTSFVTDLGETTQFSARVTPVSPASGTPTGTVQFASDGTAMGAPVPVDTTGGAAITTNALGIGNHSITATYSGDANFLATTSGARTHTVRQGRAGVTLSTSKNPTVFGEPIAFTATVGAAPGAPAATGQVRFTADGVTLGTAALSAAGTATLSGAGLSVGPHDVTATYTGDSSYLESTSAAITQRVKKGDVTVVVPPPVAPTTSGGEVIVNANIAVLAPASGTPSGNVQFAVDGAPLGAPVPISGGLASIRTTALAVGTSQITAHYLGDQNFNEAMSTSVGFDVNPTASTISVTSAHDTSAVGELVTFTVTAAGTGSGTPTGPVVINVDGAYVTTVTLDQTGRATFATATLRAGDHSVVADYPGDGTFGAATSTPRLHTVNPGATTVTVSPQAGVNGVGEAVTLTASIAADDPAAGTPSGTIQFLVDGSPFGDPIPTASATATLQTNELTAGDHQISATYSGSTEFLPGTSRPAMYRINPHLATVVLALSTSSGDLGDVIQASTRVQSQSPNGPAPTGAVQFMVNGTPVGNPVPVTADGTAMMPLRSLAAGVSMVTASYTGDTAFRPASSDPASVALVDPSKNAPKGPDFVINNNLGQPDVPSGAGWTANGPSAGGNATQNHAALPATGAPIAPLGTIAVVLIVAGTGMLAVRRRLAR